MVPTTTTRKVSLSTKIFSFNRFMRAFSFYSCNSKQPEQEYEDGITFSKNFLLERSPLLVVCWHHMARVNYQIYGVARLEGLAFSTNAQGSYVHCSIVRLVNSGV